MPAPPVLFSQHALIQDSRFIHCRYMLLELNINYSGALSNKENTKRQID